MSHDAPHSKKKKDHDPFWDLPDDVKISDKPSPQDENKPAHSQSQSLLEDLVLAPLSMVTFIVSLLIVERQGRLWRLSQRSNAGTETPWHQLGSRLHPEPYQSPGNSTWGHSDRRAASPAMSTSPNHGWYTRKKHRAIAKMEINDAFEMRGRVLFALLAWSLVALFLATYIFRRVYAYLGF